MNYREIDNDIKRGVIDKPAPILLCGAEPFLIDFYEKKLGTLFSGGSEAASTGLDLSVFYGDEDDDDSIMGALDTFPMLSPLRVVTVRRHLGLSSKIGGQEDGAGKTAESKVKKKNDLASYISQLPETARLIFTSDSINKTRALYKAIAKHGTVYEFSRLDEADLLAFVKKHFRERGMEASPEVLEALIFANGYLEKDSESDMFSVKNDVCKVALFAQAEGRSSVMLSDIEECLPDILSTDVFAMLDAISSGRKAEAVRLLENSLAGGENAFRLLALFIGQFEIMFGYKELSAKGHGVRRITQMLGERSEWRVGKLGGFAGRFEARKLLHILSRLYETERAIKFGDISDRLALTVLLSEI